MNLDQNVPLQEPISDDKPKKKKRRSKELSPEEIDQIANNTVKKTTHKQTAWIIKVFRGKYVQFLRQRS